LDFLERFAEWLKTHDPEQSNAPSNKSSTENQQLSETIVAQSILDEEATGKESIDQLGPLGSDSDQAEAKTGSARQAATHTELGDPTETGAD
jgi:hypothetical protein